MKHLILILLLASALAPLRASEPNVVIVYTDDHRYTGVQALGDQQVQTPHIDQLASEGIAFTNAYLMGSFSGATCIPSRACLLTGRQLFKLKGRGQQLPPEHETLGEAFRNAGYHSHIVGKWHQDRASLARSFDSGASLMGLGRYLVDHFRMPLWDWDPTGAFPRDEAYLLQYDSDGQVSRRVLTDNDKWGIIGTEELAPHSSEVFASSAVEFVNGYESEQPFFMYLAFHAPHDPRQAPQKYKDLYPEDEIILPPSYMPVHPFHNGDMVLRDENLADWPRTPEIARSELSDYFAIITHLDDQIGRVVAALKKCGKYDNTIIVMAGDSGLAVGNHGLMGKQSVYDEDGVHVPLIIAGGPVRDQGRRIDALCYIHDIFPTICDLAGVETPPSVTGRSLLPVIQKKTDQVRDYTYHAYLQFQRAYRKGDYKLIEYVRAPGGNPGQQYTRGSRVTQLFNYKEDPWETFNLAYFPKHAELLESMRAGMRQAAEELGDSSDAVDYPYDFWDSYN